MKSKVIIFSLIAIFLPLFFYSCSSEAMDGLERQPLYHFGIWSFGGGDVNASREWLKSKNHPLYHFGIWCLGGGDMNASREWLKR
ncbi:MAG: hypothetical protein ABIL68_01195 [bacterium]